MHFECDACDAEPEGTVCSWTRTKMVCQTKRFTQDPMLVKLSEDCGSSIRGCPKMGVSENSVPLNPMVNDHYPY